MPVQFNKPITLPTLTDGSSLVVVLVCFNGWLLAVLSSS